MKTTIVLLATMMLFGGCWDTAIEGTISLPADLTPTDAASCSDITVRIRESFLDSTTYPAEVAAAGDITTGHCDYRLSFQHTLGPWVFYNLGASAPDLAYNECGHQEALTYFDGASLSNLPPLGGSMRVDLTAFAECP
ncbi:MAG: hypothetical protein KJ749_11340 [Planctomycetes bacterium]|nr:hypothetical protein [Planctomycetota bacterium]